MEKREYTKANLEQIELVSDDLLSRTMDEMVLDRMTKTIETEAPIRRSLLYKRVLNSLGMVKVGIRLLELFDTLSSSLSFRISEDGDGETVFHSSEEEAYFRPTPDSAIRYSYQIPHEEAAICLLYILENGEKNSWTRSDLYKAFLSEMGWEKSGRSIEELFSYALKDSRIKRSGNGRILK